eukprot:4006240-Pleurochrysis_carterae.AAC.1
MLSDADLYCEQMEGFEKYGKTTREKLACKLKMALEGGRKYGLPEDLRLHAVWGRTVHLHPQARRL